MVDSPIEQIVFSVCWYVGIIPELILTPTLGHKYRTHITKYNGKENTNIPYIKSNVPKARMYICYLLWNNKEKLKIKQKDISAIIFISHKGICKYNAKCTNELRRGYVDVFEDIRVLQKYINTLIQ